MHEENRRFTSDEVTAIVRRALEGRGGQDDVSYQDLEEIARQSGISRDALLRAIDAEEETGEIDRAQDEWKRQRRQNFFGHLRAYVIINGALALINLFTTGYPWVLWCALAWGIGLAFDVSDAFYPNDATVIRGAKRLLRKKNRQRRAEQAYGKY
jgi:hypothetical protein